MISSTESHDTEYFASLAEHPLIRPFGIDDSTTEEDVAKFRARLSAPDTLLMEIRYDGERCGGFIFFGEEVHTLLLPPVRGREAIKAAQVTIDELRRRGWKRMTSYYYSSRPEVWLFARSVGFRKVRTLENQVLIGGVPNTVHLLEYTF